MAVENVTGVFGCTNSLNNTSSVPIKKGNSIFDKLMNQDINDIMLKYPEGEVITKNGKKYYRYIVGPRDDKGRLCPCQHFIYDEVEFDEKDLKLVPIIDAYGRTRYVQPGSRGDYINYPRIPGVIVD